jgi:hypothetical protein
MVIGSVPGPGDDEVPARNANNNVSFDMFLRYQYASNDSELFAWRRSRVDKTARPKYGSADCSYDHGDRGGIERLVSFFSLVIGFITVWFSPYEHDTTDEEAN